VGSTAIDWCRQQVLVRDSGVSEFSESRSSELRDSVGCLYPLSGECLWLHLESQNRSVNGASLGVDVR
jgi:hypothetical protein